MVLDLLAELGIAVAFARTHVIPRLVSPRERVGKALAIKRATAALELEEVIYTSGGDPVAYSRDLWAPGALDVRVMRFLDATRPRAISPGGNSRRLQRRSAPGVGTVRHRVQLTTAEPLVSERMQER
jgi:hypothetical protein